jgi:hypothetical protein
MADHESGTTKDTELIRAEEPTGAAIVVPLASAEARESKLAPTPDEVLAESEAEDPDVGIDGTGVGELP